MYKEKDMVYKIGIGILPRVFLTKSKTSFFSQFNVFFNGIYELLNRIYTVNSTGLKKPLLKNIATIYSGHTFLHSAKISTDNHPLEQLPTGFGPATMSHAILLDRKIIEKTEGQFSDESGIQHDPQALAKMYEVGPDLYNMFVEMQKKLITNYKFTYSFLPTETSQNCVSAAVTELRKFINNVKEQRQTTIINKSLLEKKYQTELAIIESNSLEELEQLIYYFEEIIQKCKNNNLPNQGEITKWMKKNNATNESLQYHEIPLDITNQEKSNIYKDQESLLADIIIVVDNQASNFIENQDEEIDKNLSFY